MSTMRAFFWGCVLGAIVGVLYAPKRGEETRADMQRMVHEWQGQAQDQWTELREKATTVLEQGERRVNTAWDKAQSTTSLVAEKVKEQVNHVS